MSVPKVPTVPYKVSENNKILINLIYWYLGTILVQYAYTYKENNLI